jgi:hypothetical protein
MAWIKLNSRLDDEKFRRLTGVKRQTFKKMTAILQRAHALKKAKGGRPNSLSVREMLLMSLEYLREYRTYFHVAASYGVAESTAYETIKWVENTLVKEGTFSLPGKKELLDNEAQIQVVLVDATESPVQRPKKNNGVIIRERRNATR